MTRAYIMVVDLPGESCYSRTSWHIHSDIYENNNGVQLINGERSGVQIAELGVLLYTNTHTV